MLPARKRQRLSPSGDAVVTAAAGDSIPVADAADPDREPLSKKRSAPTSLFVRSLPPDATTEGLTEHFSQSYLLKHATVVLDPATKKSKGYGFVTLADPEDAPKAIKEFSGALFGTKRLHVELAQARRRVVEEQGLSGDKKSRPAPESLEAKAGRQKQRADHQAASKLIIRNLPWSINEPDKLSNLFKRYGKIKKAVLPPGKPGLSPGFGFVLLNTRENATAALEAVNGTVVDGRTLAVDWAVDKETWERHKTGAEDVKAGQEASDSEGGEGGGVELEAAASDSEQELSEGSDVEDGASNATSGDGDGDSDGNGSGGENDDEAPSAPKQDDSGTIFVRNLPFSATDDDLFDHFSQFGAVRYARVVMDHETDRSRGTAFACFYKKEDAIACLREAPPKNPTAPPKKDGKGAVRHSLLEDTMSDPSGKYTLEGRVLHVSRAVGRDEASRLTTEGQKYRDKRDSDKRRLFLLSEGTITQKSPLYNTLPPSERKLRDDSAKQRSTLVRGNPSLHLSLTRLSIRNIPRYVTSKQLKAIAREAVVGFAKDVKAGSRQSLSKEELARDVEASKAAEKERKAKGKGIVRQAKVVFESKIGSKVSEGTGAGRSRGYGFIEYNTHRLALMGLRWLNGHSVKRSTDSASDQTEATADKPKRLIVEFAIENVQVVARRRDRHEKQRTGHRGSETQQVAEEPAKPAYGKRKRDDAMASQPPNAKAGINGGSTPEDSGLRNRIIGRKRAKRRARGGG